MFSFYADLIRLIHKGYIVELSKKNILFLKNYNWENNDKYDSEDRFNIW